MLQQWIKDEPMVPAYCHFQSRVISSPRTLWLVPCRKKSTVLPKLSQRERMAVMREFYVCVYMDTHEFPWLSVRNFYKCKSQKGTSNDVFHLLPQDRDLLLCPHYIRHQARWSLGFWGFSCLQLPCVEESQDHRSSVYSSWCIRDLDIWTQVLTPAKQALLPTQPPLQPMSILSHSARSLFSSHTLEEGSYRVRAAQWRDSQVQKWNLLPAIIWVKSEMDPQAPVKHSDETTKDTSAASGQMWGGAARFPNSYSV